MGGKSSGTTYTSSGERRNVARKTLNMMRKERKTNPSMRSLIAKRAYRDEIMNRQGNKELKDKIILKEKLENTALQLYETYKSAGITWSACMQAAKTDWVSELHHKWSQTLARSKDSKK